MITCGVNNSTIREKLLQDDSLSLEKAIELCSVIEMSKMRSEEMDKKIIDEIRLPKQNYHRKN